MNIKMRNYLIKPASGLCNMRCKYCFYVDEMKNRECPSRGVMNSETMEALIKRALEDKPTQCLFAFQGGEPTMAGLDYFRAFTETVRKYNTDHIKVSYAIQTNGYAIDEEWAAFLAENKFLAGLSLDGYPDLHNRYRVDAAGKGTAQRVMKTAALFDRYGVEYNILTVITAQTARHIRKIYQFFAKQGYDYQQYIPCLDPIGENRGEREYSLTPELYARFLKDCFDLWYDDLTRGRQISIRYFENLVGMLLGQNPEACGMAGRCSCQFVVEADGRVYPCDFYALDEYCIGNVLEDSVEHMEEKCHDIRFIENSLKKEEECAACRWYPLCRGGCRRDRDTGEALTLSYYCESYKEFFSYAYPYLQRVAEAVQRGAFR